MHTSGYYTYERLPSFVIAFHGCDIDVKKTVLLGQLPKPSLNVYDWLGSGFYCWEQSEQRAYEFATEAMNRKKLTKGTIHEPAVLGLVVDLGKCLNLLDSKYIEMVKTTYAYLLDAYSKDNKKMPCNRGAAPDYALRDLDCLVIEQLHNIVKKSNGSQFDTVRGMFPEGEALYEGAGFRNKSHIQICIRNLNCIKAFFDPRDIVEDPFCWIQHESDT